MTHSTKRPATIQRIPIAKWFDINSMIKPLTILAFIPFISLFGQDKLITTDGDWWKRCFIAGNGMAKGRKGDSMPIRFYRRSRYWTDGAFIGSKAFVQEVGCMFEEHER